MAVVVPVGVVQLNKYAIRSISKNKKEIDIDNEIEKRWDDFYEWLHTCPFKWSQSRHPTSGMTAINFDIEEE